MKTQKLIDPEKKMTQAWNRLIKKANVSELIPAVLFRYGYVYGWNNRGRLAKSSKH